MLEYTVDSRGTETNHIQIVRRVLLEYTDDFRGNETNMVSFHYLHYLLLCWFVGVRRRFSWD